MDIRKRLEAEARRVMIKVNGRKALASALVRFSGLPHEPGPLPANPGDAGKQAGAGLKPAGRGRTGHDLIRRYVTPNLSSRRSAIWLNEERTWIRVAVLPEPVGPLTRADRGWTPLRTVARWKAPGKISCRTQDRWCYDIISLFLLY